MDKLKEPAMALTVANTAAIAAVYYMLNKKIEAQAIQINNLSQAFSNVAIRVRDLEKGDKDQQEIIKLIKKDLLKSSKTIKQLSTIEDVDIVARDLEELVQVLKDKEIEVALPSKEETSRKMSSARSEVSRDRRTIKPRLSLGRSMKLEEEEDEVGEIIASTRQTARRQTAQDE